MIWFFVSRSGKIGKVVLGALLLAAGAPGDIWAQTESAPATPIELPALAVEAGRRAWDGRGLDPLARAWNPAARPGAGILLDDWLATSPSFGLYRRDGAQTAHPTTQGVSLRRLGPTAASRSLVLKDGVPQNDPFGGWVAWSRFLPIGLTELELLPAPEALAWGPLTAGGAILLESGDLLRGLPVSRARVAGGLPEAGDLQFLHHARGESVGWGVQGRWLKQRGDYLVHSGDRGAIDRRAELELRAVEGQAAWGLHEQLRLDASASYFREERGNGSPLARNATEGGEASLRLRGAAGATEFEGLVYGQWRDFENTFTAFNDARTEENPVLDQFAIPSSAWGASGAWSGSAGDTVDWMLGIDGRLLTGETREDYAPGLVNRRVAGGDQNLVGAFAKTAWTFLPNQTLELSARGDRWALRNGMLQERSKATGAVLADRTFPDRSGWEPTGAVSWNAAWSPDWQTRLGVARTFRLPTLNELYRPYRVGVDVFAANADLAPERFTTLEASVEGRLNENLTLHSGVYWTEIEDAVANVFRFAGPGPSEAGFVPAGGTFNRRENLEKSHLRGWETSLRWRPAEGWGLTATGLWQRATFTRSRLQPELAGRHFPFAPALRWRLALDYATDRWGGELQWSGDSAQYDDALNQRRLAAADRWDLGLWWRWSPQVRLTLDLRNLTDTTVLTGVASDGERSIAPGRSLWLGIEFHH